MSVITIDGLDWADIATQLDGEGHALLPGLLCGMSDSLRSTARDRAPMRGLFQQDAPIPDASRARAAPSDRRHGEQLYFDAGLPAPLDTWRSAFYRHLAVIANRWSEMLGVDDRHPPELGEFLRRDHDAGRARARSHLNRLGVDEDIALHRCDDGEPVFPMRIVALLSEPGVDFLGGEFVMVEQRPRMQSRPIVVPLGFGDAAIIAAAERPVRGARGVYRVSLTNGIGRVRQGERIGLELSFGHLETGSFSAF
ncbi:MAG: 2OG-Fe(II) oxygenase [Burkholderiaceae bacterium]